MTIMYRLSYLSHIFEWKLKNVVSAKNVLVKGYEREPKSKNLIENQNIRLNEIEKEFRASMPIPFN